MQGHIHKRVRTDRHGKETVRWYVVIDRGFDHEGRRRQKWHGGFRTRREAEAARAKLVNDVNTGSYVAPAGRRSTNGSRPAGFRRPSHGSSRRRSSRTSGTSRSTS
jgi:hypothetical protein